MACVILMTRPFQQYHKFWTCYHDRNLWLTFEKTLTFATTFFPFKIKLSYLACVCLMTRPFQRNLKFWTCYLDCDLQPTFQKTFKIGHNFFILRDMTFIFCISSLWRGLSDSTINFEYVYSRTNHSHKIRPVSYLIHNRNMFEMTVCKLRISHMEQGWTGQR